MTKGNIALSILVVLSVAACIQPVEIKPPEKSEVVLKCILMNDTLQRAEVYYSGAFGDTSFTPVEDAKVVITTKGNSEYEFSYVGEGCYACSFRPYPGREYQLNVAIPGRDPIIAFTTFPKAMNMNSYFYPPEEWLEKALSLRSKDWKEYNNVYPWAFNFIGLEEWREKEGVSILDQLPGMLYEVQEPYPKALYVVGVNTISGKQIPVSELATNHKYVDPSNMNKSVFHVGDTVSFETDMKAWFNQKVSSRYDGLPMYDDYLRIASPEKYDNGLEEMYRLVLLGQAVPLYTMDVSTFFSVVGNINYRYWKPEERDDYSSLYFCSVSEDYDRYLQDCRHQMMATDGDLLATLYSDASRIYTNVSGGYGIFGGMYVLRHDCDLKEYPAGSLLYPPYPTPFDYLLSYPPYPAPLPEL